MVVPAMRFFDAEDISAFTLLRGIDITYFQHYTCA
jgi:hypothetical protein